MTPPAARPTAARQPSLADLTARFVAESPCEADGCDVDVEPYEVLAGFRTEPRAAWSEATAALKLLGVAGPALAAPSDWAATVRQLPATTDLPLALGHFPQQVSDLAGLIAGRRAVSEPQPAAFGGGSRQYVAAAERSPTAAKLLAAAAVARLAGEFDTAERLIVQAVGADASVANERAALLWQRGRHADAVAIWEQAPASAVTAFNLGMAYLFAGRSADAKAKLAEAVAGLPESSGWNHLAQLYLALVANG